MMIRPLLGMQSYPTQRTAVNSSVLEVSVGHEHPSINSRNEGWILSECKKWSDLVRISVSSFVNNMVFLRCECTTTVCSIGDLCIDMISSVRFSLTSDSMPLECFFRVCIPCLWSKSGLDVNIIIGAR